MVVGEASGDALGASLLKEFQARFPDVYVEGILGPQIISQAASTPASIQTHTKTQTEAQPDAQTPKIISQATLTPIPPTPTQSRYRALFPMDLLNVMGLFEPLKRLPALWNARRVLIQHFKKNPPDVFIGIDAPDFNLGLEKKLRDVGIKTVHYVSPTIWAWRPKRIYFIKKAVDLMLSIFPFEKKIYDKENVPCCFVGHTFADQITLDVDSFENVALARKELNLSPEDPVIAILPGSRDQALYYHTKIYLETAQICFEKNKNLKFVVAVVSSAHKKIVQSHYQTLGFNYPLNIVVQDARLAMRACDVALVTSGTATLEIMLHKKPMVVSYRMHPLTYHIAKHLVKTPYFAMANIIAEEELAPEFIQNAVKSADLARSLLELLQPSPKRQSIIKRYTMLHQTMQRNASFCAMEAILNHIESY